MGEFLVISTGGTIASRPGSHGLTPSLPGEELLSGVREMDRFGRITVLDLLSKDSSNMSPEDWKMMAACLRAEESEYDGFSSFTVRTPWRIPPRLFPSSFRVFQNRLS
jgi:L-asparaginase